MSEEPKLYIVDDDLGMRESLRFLFGGEGIESETFASAAEFLAAGGAAKSGCVLIDVRMPRMNGLELQEHLAKSGSPLSVIVMTGHADVPMAVSAMRAGAFDFIEKPLNDEAVIGSVRRALEKARLRDRARAASLAEAEDVPRRLASLTPREKEVLEHLVKGSPHKVIAHELKISPRTIEVHRARIMQKMEARNLAHLVQLMLTGGQGRAGE